MTIINVLVKNLTLADMELKRSSLSPLNVWHLVRKWVSSSISWFVQFLHILLFLSILVFLPVSIKSLWEDVRNLQMDFLYSYFFTNVKYFSNLKLVFKNKYVVSFPSFNDLLVSFQSDKYFWLRHFPHDFAFDCWTVQLGKPWYKYYLMYTVITFGL